MVSLLTYNCYRYQNQNTDSDQYQYQPRKKHIALSLVGTAVLYQCTDHRVSSRLDQNMYFLNPHMVLLWHVDLFVPPFSCSMYSTRLLTADTEHLGVNRMTRTLWSRLSLKSKDWKSSGIGFTSEHNAYRVKGWPQIYIYHCFKSVHKFPLRCRQTPCLRVSFAFRKMQSLSHALNCLPNDLLRRQPISASLFSFHSHKRHRGYKKTIPRQLFSLLPSLSASVFFFALIQCLKQIIH